MTSEKVLFICVGETDYRVLEPVADEISEEFGIKFLSLNSFLKNKSDSREAVLSLKDIPYQTFDATDFARFSIFKSLPCGMSYTRTALQRFILDHVSHEIGYEINHLLSQLEPDLIITSVDQPPFIRHIIREAHDREMKTITLQHGFYEYALNTDKLNNHRLYPSYKENLTIIEILKRWAGFSCGVTEYTHPYTDEVLTFGDFFTDIIRSLRVNYPNFGKTSVKTVGTTEFGDLVNNYDPGVDSVLFLSQQQLEAGVWSQDKQRRLLEILEKIDKSVSLTVRPHPKGSEPKIKSFKNRFNVSQNTSLEEDILTYDLAMTVNSTAILEAVIQGKPVGVLQLPWYPINFEPLSHPHMIQISETEQNLDSLSRERSISTQRDYLRKFCYMPSEDKTNSANSSREIIADRIRSNL